MTHMVLTFDFQSSRIASLIHWRRAFCKALNFFGWPGWP